MFGWWPWSQHFTNIANNTDCVVKVKLTDSGDLDTTQIMGPYEDVRIPTPKGRVTVNVYRKYGEGFGLLSENCYSDDSDKAFIVKKKEGQLMFVRSWIPFVVPFPDGYDRRLYREFNKPGFIAYKLKQ